MDMLEVVAGVDVVRQVAYRRIEESLAMLAVELDRVGGDGAALARALVFDYMSLSGQDNDLSNHLLHAPRLMVGIHTDIADDMIACSGKGEVGEHLLIDGREQILHATAFVALLLRFGSNDDLLEIDGLLLEDDGGCIVV